MAKKKPPKRVLFVTLDSDDHQALVRAAGTEKLTLSDTVRRAIRVYARKIANQQQTTTAA